MLGAEPRPVTPLDIPLVRRALARHLPLDMGLALTRGVAGMDEVLLSSVPLADLGTPTLVLRDGDCGYVGQFQQRADKTVAYMTFLAPDPAHGEARQWARLLEGIAFEAGKRGAHRVNAEVAADHPIFAAFRLGGFAVFSRQVLLRREPGPLGDADPSLVRPESERDLIGISTLHTNTVPRLLQQAEPLPAADCHGYVFERDGHLAGYLAVKQGKMGIVIRPYFHPEVYDSAVGAVMAVLANLAHADEVPVYVYARAYQDWLRGLLERVGFRPWTDQALMVKDTLVRAPRVEVAVLRGLEPTRLNPPITDGPVPVHKLSYADRQRRYRLPQWRRNGH